MNKELIKKYKAEFDAWVEGESLLYKTTTKDVWVQANNIDVSGLFSNPSHYIKAIVIDDSYVMYRKALAEGRTIQHISYTTGEWVDFNKGFEPTASYTFLSTPEYYRIKPEEPQFKVGDWVRAPSKCIYQINEINIIHGTEHFTPWQPTEGEWCWFYNSLTDIPTLSKLISIEYIYERPEIYLAETPSCIPKTSYGYSPSMSFRFCEPFIGQLPSFLKDNT